AGLIAAISEISQRSSFIGGLLASLPFTSLLAFIWLFIETKDKAKVVALSNSIFWLVLPSLSFFVVFPILLKKMSFQISMLLSIGIMLVAYYGMVYVLSKFGIAL
ncbi:MAG: DUF3147 family protein, partial [Chloroflexota bacterium]